MEGLKPNGQRAKYAIMLIRIILIVEIISFVSGYFQYDLLQTIENGGVVTENAAESNDLREKIIGYVSLLLFIISAITFISWLKRAYYNLQQKKSLLLSYTPGWVIGVWFVPIVNLYRPYQIVKELYLETIELLDENNLGTDLKLSTKYLGAWWTLWILSGIIGQFVLKNSTNADTVSELTFSTLASMLSNLLSIPLSLITNKIISDYSKAEPQLYEIKM